MKVVEIPKCVMSGSNSQSFLITYLTKIYKSTTMPWIIANVNNYLTNLVADDVTD